MKRHVLSTEQIDGLRSMTFRQVIASSSGAYGKQLKVAIKPQSGIAFFEVYHEANLVFEDGSFDAAIEKYNSL